MNENCRDLFGITNHGIWKWWQAPIERRSDFLKPTNAIPMQELTSYGSIVTKEIELVVVSNSRPIERS